MTALGRKREHQPATTPQMSTRQTRAGVLVLVLILLGVLVAVLWAKGGLSLLAVAWEGIR